MASIYVCVCVLQINNNIEPPQNILINVKDLYSIIAYNFEQFYNFFGPV